MWPKIKCAQTSNVSKIKCFPKKYDPTCNFPELNVSQIKYASKLNMSQNKMCPKIKCNTKWNLVTKI